MNSNKILFTVAVVGLGMFAMLGCRLRASGYIEPPPPLHVQATVHAPAPPTATIHVSAPTLQAGVTVIESSCVQGAQEVCNGLDDNCNGQIDEGCGYQSGNIQITTAWNSGADIDMYVTDPNGETLSYQHTQVGSGGYLDHDARGNCRPEQENNRIENIYWNSPSPPRGNYQVELHYWGECNMGGPTTSTVSIAVGGAVIGAYNYTLSPNQRATIATFNIP
jgi:hypothetical protein